MSAGLRERKRRVEYGDFQTPTDLATAVCRALRDQRPATLIEPTCGTGAFLSAAIDSFPRLRFVLGVDINPRYVAAARRAVASTKSAPECRIRVGNFFRLDWPALVAGCADPVLILGNPPWVTNSALGALGGRNLPPKHNLPGRSGLEGLTGKSNFDVSEWMIYRLLEAAAGRRATLAMLCKTAVARRVLARAWEARLPITGCEIRAIDALRHFGARVEACLLVCHSEGAPVALPDCRVFEDLEAGQSNRAIGWRHGRLVADVAAYDRVRHLLGGEARWRSGIKHDCSAVFELWEEPNGTLVNGLGETVDVEEDYLFPLVKSSDVAGMRRPLQTLSHSNGRGQGEGSFIAVGKSQKAALSRRTGRGGEIIRHVLVPQRRVGQETDSIARRAPKTWRYLQRHAERLDRRASRVYQQQPRFSIFGVGPYTFAPWKVVVSGFYKTRKFVAVGPVRGRPVVCDDTCYFLPCQSGAEATSLARLLNGPLAGDFFSAFVFPDAKRPLTAEILGLLNVAALKT
ncbi:MAG TPA: hypothetical protein VEI07_22180, partial [Planctomycetaceae bacterium]|nr:hypothetical protein [Planctomycetaceae bacterium]